MVGDRLITQARLVEDGQLYTLEIHDGIITACSPQTPDPPTGPTLDLGGDWLSLGGVDLPLESRFGNCPADWLYFEKCFFVENMLKKWQSLKIWQRWALVGGIVFLWGVGAISQMLEDQANRLAAQQAEVERVQRGQMVESVLARVAVSSGYRPQVIQWGDKPTLTMERGSYLSLSLDEKSLVKEWMADQYGAAYQIIIGRRKDARTIYMDQQIYPPL